MLPEAHGDDSIGTVAKLNGLLQVSASLQNQGQETQAENHKLVLKQEDVKVRRSKRVKEMEEKKREQQERMQRRVK